MERTWAGDGIAKAVVFQDERLEEVDAGVPSHIHPQIRGDFHQSKMCDLLMAFGARRTEQVHLLAE